MPLQEDDRLRKLSTVPSTTNLIPNMCKGGPVAVNVNILKLITLIFLIKSALPDMRACGGRLESFEGGWGLKRDIKGTNILILFLRKSNRLLGLQENGKYFKGKG